MAKKILIFVCVVMVIPVLVMAQSQNAAQASSHPGRNIVIVLSRILTDIQNLVEKLFVGSNSVTWQDGSGSQTEATSTQAGRAVFDLGQGFLKQADQMVTSNEIKALSQQQLDSTKRIVQTIDDIQNRSRLETFIFGPDYTDLSRLDQAVNDIGNKIIELDKTAEKAVDLDTKQSLQEEASQLIQQKTQLNDFIDAHKNAISLFGLVRHILGF